jgi:YqaJ-like viral recombinase domain
VITERKLGPVEIIEADEVEQGSDAWFHLRLGLPTASNFATIMASGKDGGESKTRRDLMYRLAGEILCGKPAEEGYKSKAMARGSEMESEAREYYERTHFVELRQVGFVRRKLPSGRYVGCSPDAIVGPKKALELKSLAPHLMIERLVNGAVMPPEHRAQTQGTLWVGDFEEIDLLLFYSGMPISPEFTIYRDETYIRQIEKAVEIFDYETRLLVDKIKRMGS